MIREESTRKKINKIPPTHLKKQTKMFDFWLLIYEFFSFEKRILSSFFKATIQWFLGKENIVIFD